MTTSPQRRAPLARIDSREALLALTAGPLPRRVEFDESFLAPEQAERWQRELNHELGACGCGHAAVTLIFGLITLAAIAYQIPMGAWWLRAIAVILVASAAMSVVKIAIVNRAHRRARRLARGLAEELDKGRENDNGQLRRQGERGDQAMQGIQGRRLRSV